ncbi:hypothetical protein TCSYLVIO_009061 [Trypanosoma cruzi]|uniref:Uncharacterized protein n=1 Tax=Trypanosoma cruzi TaxID=5693 RepID=A0A2V2V1E6_TRYCR|nr:hypothetical protein TCSYLVIO_009061 [Trypanosoma cruzi]KAF8289885.1 hypothetical protein TcBrA4_0135200 [Trypanosoma cruzi]PWU89312.1 hypothetical protein C4B63_61g72 [Trypanosoma cruzi]
MSDTAELVEEMPASRDGELQQPPMEERPPVRRIVPEIFFETQNYYQPQPQPQPQPQRISRRTNGGRMRLDGKPPEAPQIQTPVQPVAAPRLLQLSRRGRGPVLERMKIRAASVASRENGLGGKAAAQQKRFSRGGTATRRSPHGDGRYGAYGKLLRDAARELAMRSPSGVRSADGGSPTSSARKKERGRSKTASCGRVSPEATPTIHSFSVSARGSTSRERRQQNVSATKDSLGDIGEAVATASRNGGRQSSSSVSALRRVVHQPGPIRPENGCVLPLPCQMTRRKVGHRRLIVFDDLLWKREKEHRWPLPNGETKVIAPSRVPQLTTEAPALPAVLEVALADHYLAVLMTCPQSEVERVVAKLSPNGFSEVVQYLRQTYSAYFCPNTRNYTSVQPQPTQSAQRAEWLMKHRRHVQGRTRSIASGNAKKSNANGTYNLVSKEVRQFLKLFTREVCMTFMDEGFAACAMRRERARAEQPQEVKARGVPLPADVLDSLYSQVVTQLLFQILGWTEKEASRVLQTVVRQIKRCFLPSPNLSPQM